MDNKSLRRALTLSVVPRWAIVNTIKQQSVAEHTHNVASIARWLLEFYELSNIELADVLIYALDHDTAESVTGDVPATAKRAGYVIENTIGRTAAASNSAKELVKLADHLEAKWFIRREMALGNTTLNDIDRDIDGGIIKTFEDYPWLTTGFGNAGTPPVVQLLTKFFRAVDFNIHPGLEAINAL